MASIVLILRATLSFVFLAAGALKLIDPGFVPGLTAFGVTGRTARLIGRLLPWLELATGVALLWPATSFAAGVVALAMLVVFTAVIVATLRRGVAPPCNCFGVVDATPIDRRTIWRNVGLAGLALAVVVGSWIDPGSPVFGWLVQSADASVLLPLTLVLATLLAASVIALRRSRVATVVLEASVEALHREIDMRNSTKPATAVVPNGLPLGAALPVVTLSDTAGRHQTLAGWLDDASPVLLFSLGSECGSCKALYPSLTRWAGEQRARLRMVAVYDRVPDEPPALGPHVLVLTASKDVLGHLRLPWTPGAVLISGTRLIGSPTVFGTPAIEALVSTIVASTSLEMATLASAWSDPKNGLPIGDLAPPLEGLPAGAHRILLFWRAGCPYCRAIKSAVERVFEEATRTDSQLVGVNWSATEPLDIERALHVRDEHGAIARAFGVRGTPSAVRVGADGRVQSVVVAGGPDVLALLGGAVPPA
jgi:thiol-disulfide isomerase/thioredoxin